ncbi:MAG TPA: hypothetical protein VGD80_22350 [Kofleriaceae bacterium]
MSKVSLRRLLSKLTALALTTSATSAVGAAAVDPVGEVAGRGDQEHRAERDALDPDDVDLDASLPIDREQLDTEDAASALGRSLALALAEVQPLSATYLAASWSLSSDALRRRAVAHALEWAFPLVGDALVIDHLSHDGDPAIRAAVARAAWARRLTGGDLGVLARLSADPDPAVRAVATSARPS